MQCRRQQRKIARQLDRLRRESTTRLWQGAGIGQAERQLAGGSERELEAARL